MQIVHRCVTRAAIAAAGCALAASTAAPAAALTAAPAATTGSLIGQITAPRATGSAAAVPVAGIAVTATAPDGATYTTTTAANGWYDLEDLPAPATYAISAVARTAAGTVGAPATASAQVAPAATATAGARLAAPVATVTGVVTDGGGVPVRAVPVTLTPTAGCAAAAPGCAVQTAAGAGGRFTAHVAPGTYTLYATDAGSQTPALTITAGAGATTRQTIALPATPVPAGTVAHRSSRDLRWLNAQRAAAGLPAGVAQTSRWSDYCAAHDAYEHANGVLTSSEDPSLATASPGGAWAAVNGDLAAGRWTRRSNPWEDAPIHLLALLAPSLSVVGIDDSGGYQCVTTYPGMLRAPTRTDRIFTYPANGARGVARSEIAHEAPFVPNDFVGIPNGRATGRELFVYLDLARQLGQAPVQVLAARLVAHGHPVALRWVDSTTRQIGPYLAGAILIPVRPLRPHTRYTATVKVKDRSGSERSRFSFLTR